MKKNKKVIGIVACILIAIVLLVVLVSNKKDNENTNLLNIIGDTPITSSKKIKNYIDIVSGDYYMKSIITNYYLTEEEEEIKGEYAVSGNKSMMTEGDYETKIIVDGNTSYYIMRDSKMIYKAETDEEEEEILSPEVLKILYTSYFETNFVKTGNEKIKGEEYYYEEYKDQENAGGVKKYYFDENDVLKYMLSIGTEKGNVLTEMIEFTSEVDESLFELPEDYTIKGIEELYNELYEYGEE